MMKGFKGGRVQGFKGKAKADSDTEGDTGVGVGVLRAECGRGRV
jgi:hypothetical protein